MKLPIAEGVKSADSVVGVCRLFGRDKDSLDACILDFNGADFLHVGEIAALAMYARQVSRNRPTSLVNHQSARCYGYLQRINFFNSLGIDSLERFVRHDPNGEFLEITEIIDDEAYTTNSIPAQLRGIIQKASYVDISLVSAIDRSFGEILDNVLNHSHTQVPGIAIAQHYPNKGFVEFCVADAGIGIVQSLRSNPSLSAKAANELMEMAFEFGVGENVNGVRGVDDGYGCGYGLAFASKLIEAAKGQLWAVSHDECMLLTGDGFTHVNGCWFPGTLICARIPDRAVLSESDLDVANDGLTNRPFYWDAQGNEIEDLFDGGGILW